MRSGKDEKKYNRSPAMELLCNAARNCRSSNEKRIGEEEGLEGTAGLLRAVGGKSQYIIRQVAGSGTHRDWVSGTLKSQASQSFASKGDEKLTLPPRKVAVRSAS